MFTDSRLVFVRNELCTDEYLLCFYFIDLNAFSGIAQTASFYYNISASWQTSVSDILSRLRAAPNCVILAFIIKLILKFHTSCNCRLGKFVQSNLQSPKIRMFAKNAWLQKYFTSLTHLGLSPTNEC